MPPLPHPLPLSRDPSPGYRTKTPRTRHRHQWAGTWHFLHVCAIRDPYRKLTPSSLHPILTFSAVNDTERQSISAMFGCPPAPPAPHRHCTQRLPAGLQGDPSPVSPRSLPAPFQPPSPGWVLQHTRAIQNRDEATAWSLHPSLGDLAGTPCEGPRLERTVSKLVCNPGKLIARLPDGLAEPSCHEQINRAQRTVTSLWGGWWGMSRQR